jgi:starch phosphorylase
MKLGHAEGDTGKMPFNMALLAIHTSTYVNGVSRLHGRVARDMWSYDWPNVPHDEVPIDHVTNGVHIHTWVSRDMSQLLTRYLGMGWEHEVFKPEAWSRIEDIPAAELWMTHERRRERLVAFARSRMVEQLQRRGVPHTDIARAREALLPSALTLGFARRFATYKRAALLMKDPDRLIRLLTNKEHPVQIIFAGKAHPHDQGGKQLIRDLVHFVHEEGVSHRMIFLEDYDMHVARYLVQGVDVWVNTPRRPLEASGTSGMKAVVNGGLNLSVMDGWWDEAYTNDVGWAIGYGEEYDDTELQDTIESEELYNILEREVVPCFYERGTDMLPRNWIGMMKASMEQLCPFFNTDRMVQDYTRKFYVPSKAHYDNLVQDDYSRSKVLAAWCSHVTAKWNQVAIQHVDVKNERKRFVGETLPVRVQVRLGELTPADVSVELYMGQVDSDYEISDGSVIQLNCSEDVQDGVTIYEGEVPCAQSGRHGFATRILPRHVDLVDPYSLKLICWK